jgi:hypothetical protein
MVPVIIVVPIDGQPKLEGRRATKSVTGRLRSFYGRRGKPG